jgi:integrase
MTSERRGHRRSHGDGAVYYDEVGNRWVAAVELGRRADGRRDRRKVTARTKTEALTKVRRLREQLNAGAVGNPNMTLATWAGYWLDKVASERARAQSPNTVDNWRWALSKVLPALGHRRLSSLTVEDVEAVLAANVHLSQNSVRRIRQVLADVLRTAEGRGHVTRNVARLAVVPQAKRPADRRALTPDEARAMRDAARGERLEALIVAGLTLGLRPGELAGLAWDAIDLDGATLAVVRSLKREHSATLRIGDVKRSSAGHRVLGMPSELTAALRAHKTRQAAERLIAGPDWEDYNLVFASEIGTPLDPSNVRRVLTRVSKRAGVDGVFPYLMRHAAASLLVDAGKSLEEVADLLGDRPETLLRHYRHRVRPVAEAAIGPMDAIFAPRS